MGTRWQAFFRERDLRVHSPLFLGARSVFDIYISKRSLGRGDKEVRSASVLKTCFAV